jgi:hypothetical protein
VRRPARAIEYVADPDVEVLTLADPSEYDDPAIGADYSVALNRYGMRSFFPTAPVANGVERDGVTLAVVRDLRGSQIEAAPLATRAFEAGPSLR